MKDFNTYKPSDDNGTAAQGDALKKFAELAAKYEGKSGDEMMRLIIEEAEKGRKNGTLSDADIDNFVKTISPMLTEKQKKMLKIIVGKIKNT